MDAFGMGLVAAMGALATVAGASEDIDSDIGSQSNPNSQVQLAAQVGIPTGFIIRPLQASRHRTLCGAQPHASWLTCLSKAFICLCSSQQSLVLH